MKKYNNNKDVKTPSEIVDSLIAIDIDLKELESAMGGEVVESFQDTLGYLSDTISEYENFLDLDTVADMFQESLIGSGFDEDDETAMNEAWSNYTDILCKDNEISSYHYDQWENPFTP